MSERATFDRILRDDDDMSGQTIRQWRIEATAGHIVLRSAASDDGAYCFGMRPEDVEAFVLDLRRAQSFAVEARSLNPSGDEDKP